VSVLIATDAADVQEAVREGWRLVPSAGRTHTSLGAGGDELTRELDVSRITGIVDYDPADLTCTVRPGTPLDEIDAMLAVNGQCMPFDPPRLGAGATLGGAVAAGITGPDGFAAGIRDFVVGVRLVDGSGRLARGGGKVVKNAAGFDLPKLMVGSLGRLGVMVELSLKVFPSPAATATVRFPTAGLTAGLAGIAALARGPISLTALDLAGDGAIFARISGSAELIEARAARLARALEPLGVPLEDEGRHWNEARRFGWIEAGARLVVVPTVPHQVVALDAELERRGAGRRYGLGANVAWIAWPDGTPLEDLFDLLTARAMSGVVLTGPPLAEPLIGAADTAFARRVTSALDPDGVLAGGLR
jgi:glycolate oxidase FAD binding subunit